METSEQHPDFFEISVNLNGSTQTIQVKAEETTDGAEYFKCSLADQNITQIRQEKDGDWEQIWGNLNPIDVDNIGKAIAAKKDK